MRPCAYKASRHARECGIPTNFYRPVAGWWEPGGLEGLKPLCGYHLDIETGRLPPPPRPSIADNTLKAAQSRALRLARPSLAARRVIGDSDDD